ncbi:hypothetical protein H105_04972 [Trichophyton soudanense CBS 452.61]|uniref:ER membrane protein n=2 Tax=Trichophyton TaxID=5550 RepID=A0A022XQX6_TRISD|nr:hypothetical protein H105_04972 [Trichophyton soudanense CBS 452.61]
MWIFRIFSSVLFLSAVVLSIPLAFDVGGRTCGLAFSLSLSAFYFFLSLLKLTTPRRSIIRKTCIFFISSTQWLIVPALLIWSLNRFSVESNGSRSWVERAFTTLRASNSSVRQWVFGQDGLLEAAILGFWDKLLVWSMPVFQLAEGFCSLLVIQASGQVTRYLVNKSGRSDSWMIGLLVFSASIISSSLYFLWRVFGLPGISNLDSTLIGVSITCAVFLCAWGIGSGRGNPVESSLLFAYAVLCLYQIFTDYKPSGSKEKPNSTAQSLEFPPLPPIIMASYTTLMHTISALPSIIHTFFSVVTAAFSAITPSVLISLIYRLFVLYASTRIIPVVRESGARALSQEASLEDADGAGKFLGLLSWFSPSILIAVYTSLLLQHFTSMSRMADEDLEWWKIQPLGSGNTWRWVNLACTMALYAVELWLGRQNDIDGGLTNHWKND